MGGFTYSNCIREFVNVKQKEQDENQQLNNEINQINLNNQINTINTINQKNNEINLNKTIMNRNKSIEDFMKYQWSWTV